VHIYASLLGLVLALFFGVSGFVLNHEPWFELDEPQRVSAEGTLPLAIKAELDRLAVVEALRAEQGIRGQLEAFETGPAELRLRFARAGEETEVTISRSTGAFRLEREQSGLAATLGDLHRGKHTGGLGSLLIDLTAILLILVSLSGFGLWVTLPKRRKLGLVALILTLGVLAVSGVYLFA